MTRVVSSVSQVKSYKSWYFFALSPSLSVCEFGWIEHELSMMCLMIQESENSEPFVSSEIDILLLVRKFNGNLMRKYRAFVT